MQLSARCSASWPIRWWGHSANALTRCTVTVERISVEVVYARPDEQLVVALQVASDATLQSAIEQSGILQRFPEIDIETVKVGIFGKASPLDAALNPGDRVEIYRPLIADPKEARKKRAAEGKQMTKGGGKAPESGEDGETEAAAED
ncbi:MAG: RnfH family protein [Chromatiaceae bacterium]|nr:RnfH family protein [Gammaproteobacteria bacterium]MCB1881270.1 RnfH family protein [Gammaproteobacteria bacterium]MCP5448436.1 RnfH family protein [Chromatiaceae bacterium]